MLSSAGSSLSGRIIDFSIDGVGLRVPLRHGSCDANPLPASDDTIELEFPSTQLNKPISASGLVRHRVVEDRTCRYGIQFTDRAQFEHRLWPVFRQLFNRRGAFRVVPDHELPVEVPLPHLRADVTLIDISTTGVAVSVPTELELALKGIDEIPICIALPDSIHRVCVHGIIRTRRLASGARVRYGIEFDRRRLQDSGQEREAIRNSCQLSAISCQLLRLQIE